MAKPLTRAASGIGAVALATGAFLAMTPQAYAGQIDAKVTCKVPVVGDKSGTQSIKVDAPATAAAGAEVSVTVTLGPSPATSPVPMQNVKATPSIDFKIGSSTVTVTGSPVTINFEAQKPIPSPPYTGKLKIPAGATGAIDLIPVKMVTDADVPGMGKMTTPCTIDGAGSVAKITISGSTSGGSSTTTSGGSSTTTSGGSSTTSSGGSTSTSGGTTSAAGGAATTTGDSLPKTGPLDDALSMGLVGGTVGLLGIGAVLVATRKVRNSRNAAA